MDSNLGKMVAKFVWIAGVPFSLAGMGIWFCGYPFAYIAKKMGHRYWHFVK